VDNIYAGKEDTINADDDDQVYIFEDEDDDGEPNYQFTGTYLQYLAWQQRQPFG